MDSFLIPGGHPKSLKSCKNVIPELTRTPSENSVEIHRFFDGLKPRKQCCRQHGSFILTFATKLEIASERLPKNLLLGSLWSPKCIKFGIRGRQKRNEQKLSKMSEYREKGLPTGQGVSRQKSFFWTPLSRPGRNPAQGGAGPQKSSLFHQNINKKSSRN